MNQATTTSRSLRSRALWTAVALLPLGVQSCSLSHGAPEIGDTATHWLQRCDSDSSCGDGQSCVGTVCTAACDTDSIRQCTALHKQASCEPQTQQEWGCDLLCADDASCGALGTDYTCSAGRCRTRSDEAASAPLALAAGVVSESDAFLLSDIEKQAGVPAVFWRDDHWTVSWAASNSSPNATPATPAPVPEASLQVVQVMEDGSMERFDRELESSYVPFVAKGNDGQLLLGVGWPEACGLRIFDTQNLEQISAATLCAGDASAARIPNSSDWLVAWATDDPVPVTATVKLARFRPSRGQLIAGPWTLGSAGPDADLTVAAVGSDAVVIWEGETQGVAGTGTGRRGEDC